MILRDVREIQYLSKKMERQQDEINKMETRLNSLNAIKSGKYSNQSVSIDLGGYKITLTEEFGESWGREYRLKEGYGLILLGAIKIVREKLANMDKEYRNTHQRLIEVQTNIRGSYK